MHPFFCNIYKICRIKIISLWLYDYGMWHDWSRTNWGKLSWYVRSKSDGWDYYGGALHWILIDIKKLKQPICGLGQVIGEHIPVVSSNHYQAAEKTLEILLNNKCRHVIQLVGSMILVKAENDYASCCHELFLKHGIQVHQVEVGHNTFTTEKI